MSSYSHPLAASLPRAARDLGWFVFGSAYAFAIPYLGVSVLDLQHDVFYAAYFAAALLLIGAYLRVERVDLRPLLQPRLRWSIGVGIVLAAVLVLNVVRTEDATDRPAGLYFTFELLWRGVGYGLVDVVLLTVFPSIVAFRVLNGRVGGLKGKLRFTALALPLVLVITAAYHLGYPQFRDDGVSRPETGNVLISIPAFATANPAGAVVAHVSQHVAAVIHSYESRIFNPPVTTS